MILELLKVIPHITHHCKSNHNYIYHINQKANGNKVGGRGKQLLNLFIATELAASPGFEVRAQILRMIARGWLFRTFLACRARHTRPTTIVNLQLNVHTCIHKCTLST